MGDITLNITVDEEKVRQAVRAWSNTKTVSESIETVTNALKAALPPEVPLPEEGTIAWGKRFTWGPGDEELYIFHHGGWRATRNSRIVITHVDPDWTFTPIRVLKDNEVALLDVPFHDSEEYAQELDRAMFYRAANLVRRYEVARKARQK